MAHPLRSTLSLTSLAALALVTACVGQGDLQGPPYEVVVLDRIDGDFDGAVPDLEGAAAGAHFALRRRQLETLDDFAQLSSPTFRIRQGGKLTIEVMNGDTVVAGAYEGGNAPDLRYVVQDGVAVPRDYATLLMFSAAYQFERVGAGLREATTDSVRAALDSHGAMDAMFAPTMVVRANGLEAALRESRNAFFVTQGWQFALAQSSPYEQAPLAADPRVLAHELGHAIFQLAFFQGDTSFCKTEARKENQADPWFEGRLAQELSMSGLNEGFADWMSFAVTGGTNPLDAIEVPGTDHAGKNLQTRILTQDTFRWSDIAKDDDDDRAEPRCAGKYCVGTLFARSLVASYLDAGHDTSDEAARHEFSIDMVSALERAQDALKDSPLPAPEPTVAHCGVREDVSSKYDPPLVGAFLEAFLKGVPRDTKDSLCRQLIDRFEQGFPNEYRKECQP